MLFSSFLKPFNAGTKHVAGCLVTIISLLTAGKPLQAQNLPRLSSGNLMRFCLPSKFIDAKTVDVWLPDGYSIQKKYAVLYMNDGQMLFDSATTWNHQEWGVDEVMGRLLQEKRITDCIVVAVWNHKEKRSSEYAMENAIAYLAEKDQPEYMEHLKYGLQGNNYLSFLVKELKPFIDRTFSVYRDASHTFIAGSSRGGIISLYAICEYPRVFGGAACLSTHWTAYYRSTNNPIPDSYIKYLANHLPLPSTHRIYFDYGTATLDSLYEPFQLRADSLMKVKNYRSTHWVTRKFEGEDHSEKAWNKRLEVPLLFLLKKK